MVAENGVSTLGAGACPQKEDTELRADEQQNNGLIVDDEGHRKGLAHGPPPVGRVSAFIRAFQRQLVAYNLEVRGIERVDEEERMKKLSWISYVQAFLLWVSINLAANNITLGMLGPAVFGLSFLDAALCGVFGALVGSLFASWSATWGPISGLRTMVRYLPRIMRTVYLTR